jgi:hypothetical protein
MKNNNKREIDLLPNRVETRSNGFQVASWTAMRCVHGASGRVLTALHPRLWFGLRFVIQQSHTVLGAGAKSGLLLPSRQE